MAGSQWREHEGQRYLNLLFGPDSSTAADVLSRALALIADEPDGSLVRVLIDVRMAPRTMGGWPLDAIAQGRRSSVELAKRFEFRVAAVGVVGPFVSIMRGASLLSSHFKIVPAPTREKALEYLIRP